MIRTNDRSMDDLLFTELEAERDWRVSDFSKMRLLQRRIREGNDYEEIYLKMTVPMIYAHWEGFCVASFKVLMECINDKNVDATDVTYNILTYANNSTFDKLKGKRSFSQKMEFSQLFTNILEKRISLSGKLDTKSNLNYKVLLEILQIFGMDESDFLEYRGELNELVNVRNAIAHGENSIVIDTYKFEKYIKLVIDLMDILLLKEVDFIQNKRYLRKESVKVFL